MSTHSIVDLRAQVYPSEMCGRCDAYFELDDYVLQLRATDLGR